MKINDSNPSSHVKFQTVFMIAGKLTAMIATFGVPLILIRLLTKSEYGIFAQFYIVVFLCTGFFNLSVQSNLYYFYPTANEKTKKVLIIQTLIFLIFVAALAVGLISIPKIGNLLIGDGDLLSYKNYILIGILLFMPVLILEPLYVVKKDIFTSLIFPPSEVLLRLTLVIGLVVIRPGLNSIFTGVIISASACLLFVLYYASKEIGLKNLNIKVLNKELAKKQLQYSIPFGLAVSLNLFFMQFDKIICISYLTTAEFAIYAISFYGIPGILQIFDSLSQVYLIKMTEKYQNNKMDEVLSIYKLLVSKTYSFALPAMLIVMLYAKKIITLLFTSNYVDAVPLFRMYLISILIFMLAPGLILRATSKTNYTLRSYLYSGIVILPLTYFLIKYIGMWGAMTGALISIALPRFLNLAQEIKLVKSNFADFFPWKKFAQITLISCLSFIPFLTLEYYFEYGVLYSILFGSLYILLVFILELKYNLLPMETSTFKPIFISYALKLKSIF